MSPKKVFQTNTAREAGTLASAATRLNYDIAGFRTLLITSGRRVASETVGAPRRALLDIDPKWGERETWAAIRRAGGPVTDFYQLFTNIIYVNIDLRRDVALHAVPTVRGERAISWTSVAGITNVVEFSEVNSPLDWTNLASRLGTGSLMSVIDPERAEDRIYRIKLLY